jgi:AmmeMemoRadiSam system protein B
MTMIIRPPAVAGTLYDADASRLFSQVETWIESGLNISLPRMPKALIVPHSGYVYSGKIAADAFSFLLPFHDQINRVVLLGRSHREQFSGVALPNADTFRTPLGDVTVDKVACETLSSSEQVTVQSELHRLEHSLEVQLPFLQAALDTFTLVPLIVGDIEPASLAQLLEPLFNDTHTLFLVSTDLSRGLSRKAALEADQYTSERIRFASDQLSHQDACAHNALNGFLYLTKTKNLDSKRISIGSSGDTVGNKDSVIGYASFVFF